MCPQSSESGSISGIKEAYAKHKAKFEPLSQEALKVAQQKIQHLQQQPRIADSSLTTNYAAAAVPPTTAASSSLPVVAQSESDPLANSTNNTQNVSASSRISSYAQQAESALSGLSSTLTQAGDSLFQSLEEAVEAAGANSAVTNPMGAVLRNSTDHLKPQAGLGGNLVNNHNNLAPTGLGETTTQHNIMSTLGSSEVSTSAPVQDSMSSGNTPTLAAEIRSLPVTDTSQVQPQVSDSGRGPAAVFHSMATPDPSPRIVQEDLGVVSPPPPQDTTALKTADYTSENSVDNISTAPGDSAGKEPALRADSELNLDVDDIFADFKTN